MLKITLLGPPTVTVGDVPITRWRSSKALALLAYLAVSADLPIQRSYLAALLWSEQPDRQARSNLNKTLSRLRKELGDIASDSRWFETTRHTVSLLSAELELDWRRLQQLFAQESGEDQKTKDYQRALALQAGEFMAGFGVDEAPHFDDWLFQQREKVSRQLTLAAEVLTQQAVAEVDWDAVIKYAKLQIDHDQWSETAWQQLILGHAKLGNHSAALHNYDRLSDLLQSELGVSPSEESIALYNRIRAGEIGADAPLKLDTAKKESHHKIQVELPHYLTPFSGREAELAQIRQRLINREYRLVSIVGPGGMGKTRLATRVAIENNDLFADGVTFVSLAPVQTIDSVPAAIAQALNLSFEEVDQAGTAQLIQWLKSRTHLLVLDNLEHLLGIVGLILDILEACSHVTILITSRERLNCQFEDIFELHGLPLPDKTTDEINETAAVSLFVDRAQRVEKRFQLTADNYGAIATICQLVGGVPLGIELAAAWVEDFSCDQISQAIATNLDFLSVDYHDLAKRHRSMRAVFVHSWDLLPSNEQVLLANLSVFRGAFSFETALEIAEATPRAIKRIRHKSLIRSAGSGRYDMHELIRQFGAEQLAANAVQQSKIRTKHSDHFLSLITQQIPKIQNAQQEIALKTIEENLENILAAWQWGHNQHNFVLLNQARDALMIFYLKRNRFAEPISLIQSILAALSTIVDKESKRFYAMLLAWQGAFKNLVGDHQSGLIQLEQALKHIDDQTVETELDRGFILYQIGQIYFHSDIKKAVNYFEQCLNLYERHNIPWQKANVLQTLSALHFDRNEMELAQARGGEGLAIRQSLGIEREIADSLNDMVYVKLVLREFHTAEEYAKRSIEICRRTNARRSLAEGLNQLAVANLWAGKVKESIPLVQESIDLSASLGAKNDEAFSLTRLALYHIHLGNYRLGEKIAEQTMSLAIQLNNDRALAWSHQLVGWVHMGLNRYAEAMSPLNQAYQLFLERGNQHGYELVLCYMGFVHFHLGEVEKAKQIWEPMLLDSLEGDHYMRLMVTLLGLALIYLSEGDTKTAVSIYNRTIEEPYVKQSRWFFDIAGKDAKIASKQINLGHLLNDSKQTKQKSLWDVGRDLAALTAN